PATTDRWDDIALILGGGDDRGCWCQPWRGQGGGAGTGAAVRRDSAQRAADGGTGPAALRQNIEPPVPPGFLPYLGAEPVGWCGVVVRTEAPRLVRSRRVPSLGDRAGWEGAS